MSVTGYLAAEGFLDQLREELTRADAAIEAVHGRLVLARGGPLPAAWAQNTWFDVRHVAIDSIADAAAKLRAIQRNWTLYDFHLHRRAKLIEAKLPVVRPKPLAFPAPAPTAPLGSWSLLDENTVLAAPRCSSPFRHGEARFVEDRQAPPNRAYLKLWEALTLAGRHPGPGELCLDLGASPGGWTWALQRLGCRVIAVDKAPLDPAVAALPRVEVRRGSAFAVDPRSFGPGPDGPVDWLFSDVVCYPTRLLALVRRWLEARACRNVVCTLKFQGATDHATARAFADIPGGRLVHLSHNKHELTWMRLERP